jgi:hypothetical protein
MSYVAIHHSRFTLSFTLTDFALPGPPIPFFQLLSLYNLVVELEQAS